MALRAFCGVSPQLASGAWVDESAQVFGDVVLHENASIWPGAVVRGDVNHIHIGRDSNIQDLIAIELIQPVILGEFRDQHLERYLGNNSKAYLEEYRRLIPRKHT